MPQHKCPSGEELVAYQDGALTPARLNEIAAHLRDCYDCRDWLRESDEIGRMLRGHIPLVDDPVGVARLMERLHEQPLPASNLATPRWTMPYPFLAACVAVVIVLGLSVIWSDTMEGGSSFTRWWSTDNAERVVPSDMIDQTPATAPTKVISSPSLPLNLALTGGGTLDADGYGEWFYRNEEGLAVRVAADPPGKGWLPVSGDDDRQEMLTFAGRELVIMYGRDYANVLSVFWIKQKSLHTLSVLEQPSDGLSRKEVLSIVAVLIEDE